MTTYDYTYWQARAARIEAESGTDWVRYELAAAMFDKLEMPAAAQRCRDRAQYYRDAPIAFELPTLVPAPTIAGRKD